MNLTCYVLVKGPLLVLENLCVSFRRVCEQYFSIDTFILWDEALGNVYSCDLCSSTTVSETVVTMSSPAVWFGVVIARLLGSLLWNVCLLSFLTLAGTTFTSHIFSTLKCSLHCPVAPLCTLAAVTCIELYVCRYFSREEHILLKYWMDAFCVPDVRNLFSMLLSWLLFDLGIIRSGSVRVILT